MKQGLRLGGRFTVKCFDENGNLKWEDVSKNLVVTTGLQHVLDLLFSLGGATQYANFYIGLTDGTPTVSANDTLATHAGWVEVSSYVEAARQEFIEARTSLTVNNSASKAVFSINATATVGGCFITSASTGTTGLLFSAAAFANGDKAVTNGDTLEVQYDFTATSS